MSKSLLDELMQETLALASPEQRGEIEALRNSLKLNAQKLNFIWAIKQARKSAGLSQRALARMTGMQQHDLSRLEKGKTNPTFETQQKLFDALGIEVKYILTARASADAAVASKPKREMQKTA